MVRNLVQLVSSIIVATMACSTFAKAGSAGDSVTMTVRVKNPTPDDWESVAVVVPVQGKPIFEGIGPDNKWFIVQNDDLDGDGKPDEMVFLASLKAGEEKTFRLRGRGPLMAVKPRAHTGMYTKTKEIRGFEGPGWESDLIAFRIYWDKRNATDVFCKTTATLSMDQFAKSDVNYHTLTPWGQDVLKVKTAVGIGGFGALIDGKVEKVADADRKFVIRANGPHRAVCDLVYTNWKAGDRTLELTARMKICGGQDFADCDLFAKATDGKPLPDLLCGFVKHTSETELIKDPKVAMVGRWGNQALGENEVPMSGNLGLSIMADPAEVSKIDEDDVNDMIVLKPAAKVSYRYMVDWFKDPQPAHSAKEFEEIMRKTARKNPIVTVVKD